MKDEIIARGKVEGVYIGTEEVRSVSVDKLILDWDGVRGDQHYGRTKYAGVREKYLDKGTEMLNLRQVSIVSQEENAAVAKLLEVEEILPEDLGANICISGVKEFTYIPYGSIIQFPYKANLLLTGDNFPCIIPGQEIQARTKKKVAHLFAKQALHKRGQTAMVLRPGLIKPGDELSIVLPKEVKTSLLGKN